MANQRAGLPPKVGHIFALTEIIMEVDPENNMGAIDLAEAILSHPASRWTSSPNELETLTCSHPTAEQLQMRDALLRESVPANPTIEND